MPRSRDILTRRLQAKNPPPSGMVPEGLYPFFPVRNIVQNLSDVLDETVSVASSDESSCIPEEDQCLLHSFERQSLLIQLHGLFQ